MLAIGGAAKGQERVNVHQLIGPQILAHLFGGLTVDLDRERNLDRASRFVGQLNRVGGHGLILRLSRRIAADARRHLLFVVVLSEIWIGHL